jgi:HAE1 family hydrophobic/amphiphilic exporter-1
MNFSALFIKRPVMTTLVMFAILLFGFIGYRALPVNDLPNVDFPTINVSASLPGANPDTMASAVATPLERQFATIAGLDSMTSSSALGLTQITLQFTLSRNIDAAAQDVQAAIAAAGSQLPPMPSPPTLKKVNPADQPIMFLALSSSTLPLYRVDEYAETLVAQRLSMISGVAQVGVFGSQKYAVRAQLDPDLLASRGIGIDEVKKAIQSGNVNMPTGTLYGSHNAFTIKANGQLTDAKAYGPLIVAYRNGAPVHLADLGEVIDSVENDKIASWYNSTRAIVLAVQRQPGTNTVQVADDIRKALEPLRAQIPGSVQLNVLFDRSESIKRSVSDVQFTLGITIALVVMVIFLFLRNISATIIPSLALPMSIVGTFAAMYLLGFSLNNLSLMALTLAVGFVVDDAIVVLENIVRHIELGEDPYTASLNGTKEIGFTVISMTLSLVAVFIPILFMGGIIGRLFSEFAVTIAVSILVSAFVSLTLTPMMCSRWLKPHTAKKPGRWYQASENVWNVIAGTYQKSLQLVLEYKLTVLLLSIALIGVTAFLFSAVPKGFMPTEDQGTLFSMTECAQGVSYDDMMRHQKQLMDIVNKDPNINCVMSSIGASGPNATGNTGRIFTPLKPRAQRKLSAEQIIEELRPKFAQVPGIRIFMQVPPAIRIGGQLTKSLYQVTLQSQNNEDLYAAAHVMEEKMKSIPGAIDVTSDLLIHSPQVNVDVDRDRASTLGVTAESVEEALSDAYGTRQISTIYAPTNQYRVIVELKPRYQRDPVELAKLYVRTGEGHMVPLSAVANLKPTVGPLIINHLGQFPSATVSFNLKPGYSLGDAVEEINHIAHETLPASVTLNFQGTAQAFQSSFSNMGVLLIIACLVIYIVLGILYESFIHPITILSGLPSAGLGALLTLILFHTDLNIYSFLGLIMLIGIVKKNAIMMIDFALDAQRKQNMNAERAIYEACIVRFRPIMMTTMAALMGTMPIALGLGTGSESRQPLGLAVVGGLVVSQLLTLYITPVVYIYLDRLQRQFIKKDAKVGLQLGKTRVIAEAETRV